MPRADRPDRNRVLALAVEPLERRTMLCAPGVHHDPGFIEQSPAITAPARAGSSAAEGGPDGGQIDIIWVNENTTSGLNDNRFDDVFGASAGAAKAVVNAVIDAWERVISSFNYSTGAPDVYNLYVSMKSTGKDLGGVGSVGLSGGYIDGKPNIGFVTLGRGLDTDGDNLGDGDGWFLDPTPNEHSEFLGDIENAYAGDAHPGSPAYGMADFYTVVAAEITHCMGMVGGDNDFQDSGYLTQTAFTDTAEGGGVGKFWTFVGPSISHLMTSNNGGPASMGGVDTGAPLHTAGPGVPVAIVNQGVFVGAEDAGNARYEYGRRYLISNTVRLILDDAYGYDTRNPEEFGTFYAVLNETTGKLTVRGGSGNSADDIDIDVDGANVVIAVDVADVPGTGHLPGAGNLNSFITRYPAADVDSIVVDAGNGADVINLWGTESPVTVNGGFGNDTINVGDDDIDSNITEDVEINGGGDTDRLNLDDRTDGLGEDFYHLTATEFVKGQFPPNNPTLTYGGFESIQLSGSDQNSTYNIRALPVGTTLVTFAGDGNDTFNMADGDIDLNFGGNVTMNGGNGTDAITFDDTTDGAGGDTYTLITGRLTKAATTVDRRINMNGMESLRIDGSNQPSTYSLSSVAANMPTTVNGGSGNDTFNVATGDIDLHVLSDVTLNGNGGTDAIHFNDSTDNAGDDEYTITQTMFSKPSRSVRYGTVESINLTGSPQNDVLRLHGSPVGTVITLASGAGADAFVLGDNDLDPIRTGFILDGQGGHDALGVLDVSDAGDDTYTFTSTTFAKTADGGAMRQFAQFGGIEEISALANPHNNVINVQSTRAGTPVTLLGGDGDDTFNIGLNGSAAGILSGVYLDGLNGTDRLSYNDGTSTTLNEYTLDGYLVRRSNVADVEARVDEMTLNCGDAADVVNVLKTNVPLTLNGQGGADAFHVGGGNWDANLAAPVTVNGNAGADALYINDLADTGLDDYTVTDVQASKDTVGNQPVSYATVERLELDANPGNNDIDVNGTFDGEVVIRGNAGNDDVNVNDNFAGRFVTVDGGAGLDDVRVNSDATGTAAVQFDSTQDLGLLLVGTGGTARLNAGGEKVLNVAALSVAGTGAIDLTDNAMIFDYSFGNALAQVQALITSGYAGGAWNGPGIRSATAAAGTTTALGYAEATDLFTTFPATFAGQTVDNTSVLIKHTFYGDANLDATVDLRDFNRLAANFGSTGASWSRGDFTYDGAVNLADFNALAANFGRTGAPSSAPDASDFDEDVIHSVGITG